MALRPTSIRVVALAAVAAAACSTGTRAEPVPTPSVAATSEDVVTPAPSPSPTEVLPANDVRDPVAALEAIVAYYDYLFEHPDPDRLALIYAERCSCFEKVHQTLEVMAQDGQRLSYARPRAFEFVEVVERDGPFAHLLYREDSPGASLIGPDGAVLERSDGDPELAELGVMLVSEEGRWRVVAFA